MANDKTEYLDEERKKLWAKIGDIENSLAELKEIAESKISIDESQAKEAFEKAKTASAEAVNLIKQVQETVQVYKKSKPQFDSVAKQAEDLEKKNSSLATIIATLTAAQTEIQKLQQQATTSLTSATDSGAKIKKIEEDSNSNFGQIEDLLSKSQKFKSAISNVHDAIFGYETEDKTHEEGLKDKLDKTYETLKSNMEKLSKNFDTLKSEQKKEIDSMIADANKQHDAIVQQIRSHLPDGVAAGLAGAFNEKRVEETSAMQKAYDGFKWVIRFMFGVAVIPLIVYVYWIITGKPIDEVLQTTPKMAAALLPLYTPLIWIGIHLNKRINLSKKLLEEYSYKEAISKTITGVSEQIKVIKDDDVSQEIHTALLRLILSASGDNPGRYIKEYNQCDNPLVDLISNPTKLEKILNTTPAGILEIASSLLTPKKIAKKEVADEE